MESELLAGGNDVCQISRPTGGAAASARASISIGAVDADGERGFID